MTFTLYGRAATGSMAIEAALDEAGLPYEIAEVSGDPEHPSAVAYAAVNPRRQVPALVCPDGLVITEGPVILSFLADSHPSASLIPAPGTPERARHDRWAAFLHANVYEGMLREFYADRYVDDPALAPSVQRAATAYVRRHLSLLDAEIGAGPYLLGDRLQMVDIYLWMLCWWADADWLRAACPAIQRLKDAADARPALAAAAGRHFG